MPVDPGLLEQVLRTPESKDVTESPIVRAIILADPANAADLVPALEGEDTLESANARKILGGFGPAAVPHLAGALATARPRARRQGLEAVFGLLVSEEGWAVREALSAAQASLELLLQDRTPLPDDLPEYVERDFRGRVCDLAFVVVQELLSPAYDQSLFRSLDDRGRDEAIRRLRQGAYGLRIV